MVNGMKYKDFETLRSNQEFKKVYNNKKSFANKNLIMYISENGTGTRFFAVWGGRNRFVVGLFLLKLLQLFQHRFLLRGLAARCGKLLLIQHHVDILADIFQGRDIRLQGFQFGTQFCAAGLQRRKFGIQCRKIYRCAAVQFHRA